MSDEVRHRADILHADASTWDPREDVMGLVRRTFAKINHDRRSNGLPWLQDADMTLKQRANAIRFVLGGEPDVVTFTTAAAQCIAALVWLLRVEDASPFTGGEAA